MKKAFLIIAVIFIAAGVFAQSAAYTKYVKLAKDYEAKKQWAFALNAWYDALGCDDAPALKTEALNGYKKLSETIYDGNPGYGNYKVSALHDEWMKLLIDAEKFGNTIFTYELTLGKLEKQSGTSNYTAKIEFKESDRYLKTIGVIAKGCKIASDATFYDNSRWGEVWPEWPLSSASWIDSAKEIPKNLAYNIDGVKIFEVPAEYAEKVSYHDSRSSSEFFYGYHFNAFAPYSSGLRVGLYDYKFNIVDNKGKEVFKGKRWLLGDGDGITLTDIPADVAKLIDSGKAFLNPVAVYLQYGKYNPADNKGGRTFIKNFPEAQLDMSTAVIYCWNKTEDKIKKNFDEALFESKKGALTSYDFIPIKGKNFEIGKTEVTQKFYEAVMGSNPSYHKGENLPAEGISWYDALYFCNELSRLSGFTPVYSVNGETDVKKWNYTPHILADLKGRIDYNPYADGYRLPTIEEWMYAAKGGENYVYAGSSNIFEVSWNQYNSGGNTHPVAQKKPNGYGLYDMNGNVSEWVWDDSPDEFTFMGFQWNYTVSGSFHERWAIDIDDVLAVISSSHGLYGEFDVGLRPVRSINIKVEPLDVKKALKSYELAFLSDVGFEIGKTEVTQQLYEAVMGKNPSWIKGVNLPVEHVSWYDAIYFCNEYSRLSGFKPVYSVNGETDVKKWNYIPHSGNAIEGEIVQINSADGYRLPTSEQWLYAAKGGQNYDYSGGYNLDEVGWYEKNSGYMTHPVAQKKPNGYGLYDMSGNVQEWVWTTSKQKNVYGGYWDKSEREVSYNESYDGAFKTSSIGFRVMRLPDAGHKITSASEIKRIINSYELAAIPGKKYEIGKTEVTQALYKAVTGDNPSWWVKDELPVERVSWYDAIYFCNELSRLTGKTPVYSVNGESDVTKWNYIPNSGQSINATINQNTEADGYRLPTIEEWQYAAKGGENYTYSGSNSLDEVGWYGENINKTHPVAQKKANGYGLYDMSGNVEECIWYKPYKPDWDDEDEVFAKGGSVNTTTSDLEVPAGPYEEVGDILFDYFYGYENSTYRGFRLARNKDAKQSGLIAIPGKNYEIGKTEVTQAVYESVMGENPTYFKGKNIPVGNISYYDILYFCNEYSRLSGLTPVYAVDGKTDVKKWNYTPHKDETLKGKITMDEKANGYRLPTVEEWKYAAKGGENYTFSGSDSYLDVAQYSGWGFGDLKTKPVAQKKANGYGLYDMSGNVEECVWCGGDGWNGYFLAYGGHTASGENYLKVINKAGASGSYGLSNKYYEYQTSKYFGFRIARNKERGAKPSGLIAIPGKDFEIGKTEVTQALYESVMRENPSYFKGENLPVENLSYYDMLYFCNEYSRLSGLTPVYAVDGKTDVKKWNYAPHKGEKLQGTITMDEKANGYRLPTLEEWEYAARGGQNFIYSGSDNIDEVAWPSEIIYSNAHPVAQKKANGYGLYDMSGNVQEWLWDNVNEMRYSSGGAWNSSALVSEVSRRNVGGAANRKDGLGFRIVRNIIRKATVKPVEDAKTVEELAPVPDYELAPAPDREAKPSELIAIPDKNFEIGKTEVTQAVYESVMGENPSKYKGENLPVDTLSFYDILYFCNEYSRLSGLTPVYSVDGETDVKKWNYNPHKGETLKGTITMDEKANGYRLPTRAEWEYAAKGGQNFTYSGSDNIDEVAWHYDNSDVKIHPVAQKKPNGYGLYDMSGNVEEWIWYSSNRYGAALGGKVTDDIRFLQMLGEVCVYDKFESKWYRGFRLAHNKDANPNELIANTGASDREAKPNELVEIPDKNFEIGKTEVTQALYESVMGENPSYFKGENLPVGSVSWYDAIYFCNEYSRLSGLTPVYAVDNKTDVKKWNYVPHKGAILKGKITMDKMANGYRLPLFEEWQYAAKGGEKHTYSGSENMDEVAWHWDNSDVLIHPVAQKKTNGYGLYDMSSNVVEWVWDNQYGREDDYGTALGGTVNTNTKFLEVKYLSSLTFDKSECAWFNGFRIVRSKDGVEIGKREAKPSELIAIPGKNYEIGKTEVTQAVYESVMYENPSYFKGEDLPVECVSWYDILYFCNEYSRLSGLTPVYAVDGKTDVKEWNYAPHKGEILHAEITMDKKANGYRLPTSEEWKYAAKGGQNFKCSGSDNVDEVAWHNDNSRGKTHPVAQKKPNGYGLYDMNGNVEECVWDSFYALGGYYSQIPKSIGIDSSTHHYKYDRFFNRGFRLARNKD